jgi:hypothetical protein
MRDIVHVDRGRDGVTVVSFGVGFEQESTVRVAGRIVRVRRGDRLIVLHAPAEGIDLNFGTFQPAGSAS